MTEKTRFVFCVDNFCEAEIVDIVKTWLFLNKFKKDKRSTIRKQCYRTKKLCGAVGFEYQINGSVLVIDTYMGSGKHPLSLRLKNLDPLTESYLFKLEGLFKQLGQKREDWEKFLYPKIENVDPI